MKQPRKAENRTQRRKRSCAALSLVTPAALWACGDGAFDVTKLQVDVEDAARVGDLNDSSAVNTGDPVEPAPVQDPDPICGNAMVEDGEECDGNTLSCADIDVRFVDGVATCNAACSFDVSECIEELAPLSFDEVMEQVSKERLKEIVYYLASDDLGGRKPGTDGDDAAQDYVEKHFVEAGLLPGNADSYRQPFSAGGTATANMIGYLPGRDDSSVRDEVIVVGGHFDHLGRRNGRVYNGADDNASGTAVVMELAYALGKLKKELKRTVVFMGFGAEEMGLIGSRYYCKKEPLFPIDDTVLMLNFDMVGRRSRSADAPPPVSKGGTDSASFQAVGVKTKGWFTGLHSDYHESSDTADKVNYSGMTQIAKTALDVLWNAAQGSRCEISRDLYDDEAEPVFLDHGVTPFVD